MGQGLSGAAVLGGIGTGLARGVEGGINSYLMLDQNKRAKEQWDMKKDWMQGMSDPSSAPAAVLASDRGSTMAPTGPPPGAPGADTRELSSYFPGGLSMPGAGAMSSRLAQPAGLPATAAQLARQPAGADPSPEFAGGNKDYLSGAWMAGKTMQEVETKYENAIDLGSQYFQIKTHYENLVRQYQPLDRAIDEAEAGKPETLMKLTGTYDPQQALQVGKHEMAKVQQKAQEFRTQLKPFDQYVQALPPGVTKDQASFIQYLNGLKAQHKQRMRAQGYIFGGR